MSGVIEIRDGYPNFSVIPELNSDQLFWEPIQITEQKHNSFSLDVKDSYSEELKNFQRLVAQHKLDHYDLEPLAVKDIGNWERYDNVWTIPVYLESDDEEIESSDKISFTVIIYQTLKALRN